LVNLSKVTTKQQQKGSPLSGCPFVIRSFMLGKAGPRYLRVPLILLLREVQFLLTISDPFAHLVQEPRDLTFQIFQIVGLANKVVSSSLKRINFILFLYLGSHNDNSAIGCHWVSF